MIDNYAWCAKCPLVDRPPVLGEEPTQKDYMIIGEAPGREEAARKHPFVGRSGELLWKTLIKLEPQISRSQVYVTNIVVCHPYMNETPTSQAVESCRERLYDMVRKVRPKKLLLLGSTASKALMGTSVSTIRGLGTYLKLDDMLIYTMATYHPAAILRDPDLFRDFAEDCQKWAMNDAPLGPPRTTVLLPKTGDEALDILRSFSHASALSCDLETTGRNPREDKIVSIAFGAALDGDERTTINVVIPMSLVDHDCDLDAMIEWMITQYEGDLVFHNIKFDMSFLRKRYGWRATPKKPWDTMLMRYAEDERGFSEANNRSYGSLGLKDIARVRYDIPDYGFDFNTFWATPDEDRDWESFYRYQALDTHVTILLFFELRAELETESPRLMKMVQEFLVPGALAFITIEDHGMMIDRQYLLELRAKTIDEVETKIDRLQEIANKPDLNPGSPKQVKAIFEAYGVPYVSGEKIVLQLLSKQPGLPDTLKEFIDMLLDYRQQSKILKTYIEGLLKRADSNDRVHGDFKLTGTDTGRLSCRDPNLQNIPTLMGPAIKRAFIAPEGWTFVNADYSQLELRVAAYVSRDPNLMKAYLEGLDIHRWVAALVFDKPMDKITSLERYMAKYVDFGIIYGRSARGLCEGFEAEYIFELTGKYPEIEWADGIQAKLFSEFSVLKEWIDRQHAFVRRNNFIETLTGRRRRFRYVDRRSVGSMERKAVNTPIQGSASDMTLKAIIRLEEELDPTEAYVIGSVHDSIMALIRNDVLEKNIEIIKRVMQTPCIDEFDIPLKVDIGMGQDWSEAKE